MALPCEQALDIAAVEQYIDNHDFDANHHTHTVAQHADGGPIDEVIDFVAGGATDIPLTIWQPFTVTHAAGPGLAGSAATLMAAWGQTTPQMVFVTAGPTGADEAWMILRDSAGTWQWTQFA